MSWRDQLHALGTVHESELGIGIDFTDGADTFWVLPGEVLSTIPIPPEGPDDVEAVIAEFRAIDALRTQALNAIRHHIKSVRAAADRRGSEWAISLEGGASTSLPVGAYMTKVARDTRDVRQVITESLPRAYLGKTPSAKRIDRYLSTPGPPDDELPYPDDDNGAQTAARNTITQCLVLMGMCKALDAIHDASAPESIRAAIEAAKDPAGPVAEALLRVAERLPNVNGFVDLCSKGAIQLDFDDGHDSFEIQTRSKPFLRRIQSDGPKAAGDHIADQYLAVNSARTKILNAIFQVAAARGWKCEEFGSALFGVGRVMNFGESRREVGFQPGEALTNLLKGTAPLPAIRQLFKDNPDFAEAVVAAYENPSPAPVTLPKGSLLPKDTPKAPPLLELDASLIAQLDDFAGEQLVKLRESKDLIWDYRNRDRFDPAIDTWMTTADWLRIAEHRIQGEWPNAAILILLDAGDPRGDQLACQFLENQEPHHEMGEAEPELCWRYRHELPEIARKWFEPSASEDMPFAEERAAVGDPVAIRKLLRDALEPNDEISNGNLRALCYLSPEKKERLHQDLLHWARTTHMWGGPETDKLRVALQLGWRDVADALPENPFMLAGLLAIARRADQFDEPGMLMAGEFLLTWSRLAPSPFLARLIATAHTTDLVGLARKAGEAAATGRPDVTSNLGMSHSVYDNWLRQLQPALAIAWKRCRSEL